MATAKKNRKLELPLTQAQVSNLNFSPEKHGDNFEPRADLSLAFIVKDLTVAEFVNTKSNPLKVLWDTKGGPMFRELGGTGIPIAMKCTGTAELGSSEEVLLTFENATLKNIKVTPIIDHQLEVSCQIRVDTTDHLDELGELVLDKSAVVRFTGEQVATGNKNEDQGKLEV